MRRGEIDQKVSAVMCGLAILLLAGGQVASQFRVTPIGPPSPAPSVVPDTPPAPEPQSEPAMVIVTDAAGKRINDESIEAVAAKLAVGQWRVQAIPKPGDVGWLRAITVAAVDQPFPAPPSPIPPVPTPAPPEPTPPAVPATAASYVYEKDSGGIPPAVLSGLNRLNREKKILASLHEIDSTDGDRQVPDQYKVAVAAAKEAGLPALVVTAGAVVVKVVKAPVTEAAVMEAVP